MDEPVLLLSPGDTPGGLTQVAAGEGVLSVQQPGGAMLSKDRPPAFLSCDNPDIVFKCFFQINYSICLLFQTAKYTLGSKKRPPKILHQE